MRQHSVRRPCLRYHGGKWRIAPWIISHFTPHLVYVEPFGGGGSVLLRKPRSFAEVYNDIDGEIVNIFRILQDPAGAAELRRLLALTPFARAEFELAYEATEDPVERARRSIIRAYMGHGSDGLSNDWRTGFRSKVYSTNTASRQRAPATNEWASYPDHVAAFAARLQGVVIENRDRAEVIDRHDSLETLFYVDPPYISHTRGRSSRYRFEIGDEAHHALAATLHRVKGNVILSGYRSATYDDLYGDWHRVEKHARADSGKQTVECLWIKSPAERLL
jgi:DNA adenine methylase